MKHVVDTLEVESGWVALRGHDPNRQMVKASLVISDERVFTESEVLAMVLTAIKGIRRDMPTDASVGLAVGNIAKALHDAGIVLNPA